MEDAVDPQPDPVTVLRRFDMNIRRSKLYGAAQEMIEKLDHRRFKGHLLEFLRVLFAVEGHKVSTRVTLIASHQFFDSSFRRQNGGNLITRPAHDIIKNAML